MTHYLISLYQPDGPAPPPEALAPIMRDIAALVEDIQSAGAWVFNRGLCPPSTATVLRPAGLEVLMTDGPFAEGKEHIGGFVIVQSPDLDAVLEWGRRFARATGLPVEVRPFQSDRQG